MKIDFCFIGARHRLCVAGWSERDYLAPVLLLDGQRIDAASVTRFRRRDLESTEPLGVLVTFPPHAVDISGHRIEIEPAPGVDPVVIDNNRLVNGEQTLIGSSVDEVFGAYLRAIAQRELGTPRREANEAALARVQATIRPLPAETASLAVNIDRLVVSPSGIGAGIGWCLADRAAERPVLALVSGGRTLRPVHLVMESLPREDLAGFSERFRYTGKDGFFCAFRLAQAPERDARLIILGNVGAVPLFFGHAANAASNTEVGEMLCDLRGVLSDPADEDALMRMIAPRAARAPVPDLDAAARADAALWQAAGGTIAPEEAETLLLLGIDVSGQELRDVLRAAAGVIAGAVEVVPLGEIDSEGRRALAAAANEAGKRITISARINTVALPELVIAAGMQVVWARASALFQMGIPVAMPNRAVTLIHDPMGVITATDQPAAWEDGHSSAAVTVAPGALMAAALRGAPHGLLTPDGVMTATLALLSRAGLLDVQRSPLVTFYPGTVGPGAGIAGRRHTPASLDSEMLERIEETELT